MSMQTTHSQHIPTAEELDAAKQQTTDIGQRTEELECQDKDLQSVISPFLRLPSEALGEIAQYCVDDYMSPIMSPVILSQVCSSMRHAVIGFKKLWNKISLSGRSTLGFHHYIRCTCEEYFQLLLQRAAPLALQIHFDNPTWLPSYLAILSPYAQHLKILVIHDHHSNLDLPETSWPPNMNFKMLHHVNIKVEQPPSLVAAVKILDLIHTSSCPSLQFSIDAPASNVQDILLHPAIKKAWGLSVSTRNQFIWTRVPLGTWPNLKWLNLNSTPSLLRDFDLPNLESLRARAGDILYLEDVPTSIRSLELENCRIVRRSGPSDTPWCFPNLVDIDMTLTTVHFVNIVAPRLETFAIMGSVDKDVMDVDDVLDVTTHPYNFWVEDKPFGSLAVKKIDLCVVEVSRKMLPGLKSLLGLQNLRLEVCNVSEEVLRCISGDIMNQGIPFFPKLEDILLSDCHVIEGGYSLERFVAECQLNRPSLRVSLDTTGEFFWADSI